MYKYVLIMFPISKRAARPLNNCKLDYTVSLQYNIPYCYIIYILFKDKEKIRL